MLTDSGRALVAECVRLRFLLAFDFDGTLAPIVRVPTEAGMREKTRSLLQTLAKRRPVAVISGRGRSDIAARTSGIRPIDMVGNHGLEADQGKESEAGYIQAVRQWLPELRKLAKTYRGLLVEEKGGSVSIHYRDAVLRRQARVAIEAFTRSLGSDVRVIGGKLVVNLIPAGAPHKGTALERLKAEHGAPGALYVGDDLTDEDVFALPDSKLVSIRIGRSRRSKASYFLRNQKEIDALLLALVEATESGPVARSPRSGKGGGMDTTPKGGGEGQSLRW